MSTTATGDSGGGAGGAGAGGAGGAAAPPPAGRVSLSEVLRETQYPVLVKMPDRTALIEILVEQTTIIEEFKYAVEDISGIPWRAQELVKADNPKVRLRNHDSGYEHGIKKGSVLHCVRCPLLPEDVRKVFVTARVAALPARRGGLTISVSDGAHTKRRDLTAKAFLPMLRDNTCGVHTLKLSNCGVGDLGCADLAEGLRSNTSLRHLVLSLNDIGDTGLGALANMLTRTRTLQSLDVSTNPRIGDEGVLDLGEALAPDPKQPHKPLNTSLRELDLSGTGVTDHSARQFAGVLRLNTTLHELRMRSLHVVDPEFPDEGRMTEGGFWALCEAVKGVPLPNGAFAEAAIRVLDLSHNPGGVGEAALRQLADSVNTNRQLRVLRLAHCEVSDAGANLLACGLEEVEREFRKTPSSPVEVLLSGNKALQELDLSGNSVSDAAVKAFARVLTAPNSGLRLGRLLLGSNAVGDTGAVALALAMQRNMTSPLIELDLSDNMLSDVGARALCLAVEAARNLQVLRLRGNLISDAGKDELRVAWRRAGRQRICLHL